MQLDQSVRPFAIAGTEQERRSAIHEVKQELLKHYPTMETLFGSLDFCECEHCRSVLSPAAYLVDLLRFIDPDQKVWDGFLEDWRKKHNNIPYDGR